MASHCKPGILPCPHTHFFFSLNWNFQALLTWLMVSILCWQCSRGERSPWGDLPPALWLRAHFFLSLTVFFCDFFHSLSSCCWSLVYLVFRISFLLTWHFFSPCFSLSFLFLASCSSSFHVLSFWVLSNPTEARGAVYPEGLQSSHVEDSSYILQTFVSALSEIIWGSC